MLLIQLLLFLNPSTLFPLTRESHLFRFLPLSLLSIHSFYITRLVCPSVLDSHIEHPSNSSHFFHQICTPFPYLSHSRPCQLQRPRYHVVPSSSSYPRVCRFFILHLDLHSTFLIIHFLLLVAKSLPSNHFASLYDHLQLACSSLIISRP